MTGSRDTQADAARLGVAQGTQRGSGGASAVIWHDVECGRYSEDLALWLRLSLEYVPKGESLLDVGAGTGRVSIPLARAGHRVVALDREPELLAELEVRAAGLPVRTICADAREFSSPERFALIIVPMQTIQLFGGMRGRDAFLRRARAHLRDGGVVAVTLAAPEDFEEFVWQEGDTAPLPDIGQFAGVDYFSQPTAVRRDGNSFVLERRRDTVAADGTRTTSEDRIALEILAVADIHESARRAGLRPLAVLDIPPTLEHIASQVVVLGA